MKEISLTQSQLEDSFATLETAVDLSGLNTPDYQPDRSQVPRPNFTALQAHLETTASTAGLSPPAVHQQRIALSGRHCGILSEYQGLRGFGLILAQDSNGDARQLIAPAILLPGGKHIALLTAEPAAHTITAMQHSLLETEYIKHLATVRAQHSPQDITNAGDIGPSLVIASSMAGSNPHRELHGLAGSGKNTFGTNFSQDQRQDIVIGHQTRHVRSTVVSLSNARFLTGDLDQLPSDYRHLDMSLTSGQLAVGLTLAASQSRLSGVGGNQTDRLRGNLSAMTAE